MEEFKSFLEQQAAAYEGRRMALAADGREDESVLERIRGNVYGIFVSVVEAAEKNVPEQGRAAFVRNNLERIPSGWRVAHQKAVERGDAVRIAQEEAKLAAIDDVMLAFERLAGDVR